MEVPRGDIDRDGHHIFMVASPDGRCHLVNKQSGKVYWTVETNGLLHIADRGENVNDYADLKQGDDLSSMYHFEPYMYQFQPNRSLPQEEMRRMEDEGTHTDVEIVKIVRGGHQRGHIPGIGPVVPPPRYSHMAPPPPAVDPRTEFLWGLLRSDDRYADAFTRFESGGASGSGTGGASGSGTGGASGSGGSAGASGSGGFSSAQDDEEDE